MSIRRRNAVMAPTEWLDGRLEREYEKLHHGEKITALPDAEQTLAPCRVPARDRSKAEADTARLARAG
jgi:hypothetical protein